jgi:hypothetical protein
MSDERSAYGEWCPTCGGSIVRVTRGIPSMGTCANGHTTDRRDTLRRIPTPPKTYTEAEVQAKVNAAVREALERAASLPITIIPYSPAIKAASDMLLAYQAAIRSLIPEVPQ